MKEKVLEVYNASNQIYGAAKIHAILKEQGEVIFVEYIRELMRELTFKVFVLARKSAILMRQESAAIL